MYSNKVNSHHFANFLHFQSNFQAQENLKISFRGKIISNHSYAQNKPLTHVLNPLCEKFSVISIVHDKLNHVINGLRPIYIFVSVRPALGCLVSSIGIALHGYHRGQGFESCTSLLAEVSHVRDLLAGKSRTSLGFFFQAFFSQM